MLAGGSAWGLAAADGAMRWLEERGIGMDVRFGTLPIVPAAVLFDLPMGDARIRPDAAAGYAACDAASNAAPAEGNVGAGSGALVGKLFGVHRAMKGGIGTASVTVGGVTVGALIAVNSLGDVIDHNTAQPVAGARTEDGTALARHPPRPAARRAAQAPARGHQHHAGRDRHRRGADQGAGQPPGQRGARRPGARHQPGAHDERRRHAVRAGHRPRAARRQCPRHDGARHHGGRGRGHRHAARRARGAIGDVGDLHIPVGHRLRGRAAETTKKGPPWRSPEP
jgi:hypothetical protein